MAAVEENEDILALLAKPKSKRKVRNKVTFDDDAAENLEERKCSVLGGELFEYEVPEKVINIPGKRTGSLTFDEGKKLPPTTQMKDSDNACKVNYVQEETPIYKLSNRNEVARKQERGEHLSPQNRIDPIAIEDLAKLLQSKLTTIDSVSKFWETRIDDIDARDERNNNRINDLVGKLYETTEKMQVAVFGEIKNQRVRDEALRLREENVTIMQRDLERKKDDLVKERREFQSKMEKEKVSFSTFKEAAALRLEEVEWDRSRIDYEIQKQMNLSEILFNFSESLMRKAEILSIKETENQCIISEADQKFEEVKRQKRNLVKERIRILKKKRATYQLLR